MKNVLTALLFCGLAFGQAKSEEAKPDLMNPASLKAQAPATYQVKFTTTKGDFVVQVNRGWAPRGADRFYNLVRAGFFTDCAFFRVLRTPRPFMAQFGISPNPAIAKAWMSANIPDDRPIESNKRGRITFATAGPNTRTTQVFINYGDNAFLDSQGFSPFGEVIEGMDVVDQFYGDYGEGAPSGRGPEQGRLQSEGKAYTDRYFPKLDKVVKATIVPASKPAADGKR